MKILTSHNEDFSMLQMPDVIEDLKYSVLDYSDQANVDFFFVPMILLESFTTPAALIQIGPYQMQLPIDWSIVIGDKHIGDLEHIEVKKLNDRPFQAFVFNPITGYSPKYYDITIIDIFPDIKWFVPKLKFGHILTIPLGERSDWPIQKRSDPNPSPDCLYVVRDINKLPDALDISKIF